LVQGIDLVVDNKRNFALNDRMIHDRLTPRNSIDDGWESSKQRVRSGIAARAETMSHRVVCTGCSRIYDLDDSLRGKKVRCKTCGTVARVPGQNPVSELTAPALSPDDLYALNEGPPAARATIKREAQTSRDDDLAPLPRASKKPSPRPRPRSSMRLDDLFSDSFFKLGIQIFFFGLVAFILPFFGLVFAPRFGGRGLPPEAQQALGLGALLIGLGLVIAGVIRSVPSAMGKLLLGSVVGAFLLGAIVTAANMGKTQFQNASGFVDPGSGQPVGPDSAPPFGQPRLNSPADSVRISLSGGKYRRHTTPFGNPLPGVEVEVDYRVDQGMAIGAKFNLVIESKSTSGKLTTFSLQPSGTISAQSPMGSVDDSPFQAHIEAESFDGRTSKSVSNTIALQRDDSPAPAPFPRGMQPGAGRPPHMPVPPGFPGMQPGRPGFGSRRPGG
jgi:hypothetical protein